MFVICKILLLHFQTVLNYSAMQLATKGFYSDTVSIATHTLLAS